MGIFHHCYPTLIGTIVEGLCNVFSSSKYT